MRKTALALTALLALAPLAEAQQSIPVMQPNTLFGRLSGGGVPGPGAAIPITSIAGLLSSSNLNNIPALTYLCNSTSSTGPVLNCPIIRQASPSNLYVATTGSDSNTCLNGSPCLTLQHAINVALSSYDLQAASLTINLAAGTYTAGGAIYAPLAGGANSGSLEVLKIVGAGSASTTLGVTNCSSGNGGNGLFASGGAAVALSGMTISTTCSGETDVFASNGAIITLDTDLKLGAAGFAYAIASTNSQLLVLGSITVTGNTTNGFEASTGSSILFFGGTLTISGSPTITQLLTAIDNSTIVIGTSVAFSGTFTGSRYSVAFGGIIDTEQNTSILPGSNLGIIGAGSWFDSPFGEGTKICIGGAGGCPVATAPTGLGSGGTAVVNAGSSGHSGSITLQVGTTASSSGVVHLSPPGNLAGGNAGTAFCVVNPSDVASAWSSTASIHSFFSSSVTAPDLQIQWFNAGALSNASNYVINYLCE